MNSKGIIAIIVVIILVAAGVGVGVFFANQNNGPGVDKIKDKVVEGDIIAFDGVASGSGTIKEMSLGDFVSIAYTDYTVPTETTKKINFKGETYECAGYEYTEDEIKYTDWVTEGGFILEKDIDALEGTEAIHTETILVDTSMDVTIDQPSQMDIVEQDAYCHYDTKNTKGETATCVKTTLSKYTKGDTMVEVTVDALLDMGVYKQKVTNVDGDNITFDDGEVKTVAKLYSELDKEKWIKYQTETLGNEVGKPVLTEKRIDKTPFGDREVITGTYEVTDKEGKKSTYQLTYGADSEVIYVISMPFNWEYEGNHISLSLTKTYENGTTMIVSA